MSKEIHLPVGISLPDIKTFNLYADHIISTMEPNVILRGSVEEMVLDKLNGKCDYCNGDLIRQLATNTWNPLVGGIIRCKPSETIKKHPLYYWIEVWPRLPLDEDERYSQNPKTQPYKVFSLSNPLVRRCYFNMDLYRIFEANRVTILEEDHGVKSRFRLFPKPDFVHPAFK